jgi:peptidoglycan hydrolase CwlO-like protein
MQMIEYLEEELEETLAKIDDIAAKVQKKELDAYEGFMETEKYKNQIVEIGNKLKEKGVDITTL